MSPATTTSLRPVRRTRRTRLRRRYLSVGGPCRQVSSAGTGGSAPRAGPRTLSCSSRRGIRPYFSSPSGAAASSGASPAWTTSVLPGHDGSPERVVPFCQATSASERRGRRATHSHLASAQLPGAARRVTMTAGDHPEAAVVVHVAWLQPRPSMAWAWAWARAPGWGTGGARAPPLRPAIPERTRASFS
jgi:hypothetical protein